MKSEDDIIHDIHLAVKRGDMKLARELFKSKQSRIAGETPEGDPSGSIHVIDIPAGVDLPAASPGGPGTQPLSTERTAEKKKATKNAN